MGKSKRKLNSYQKAKRRLYMIPVKGNQRYRPEREAFMKSQILSLLEERDKYNDLKENACSKKEKEFARLCLRTINDSIADYRKKVS